MKDLKQTFLSLSNLILILAMCQGALMISGCKSFVSTAAKTQAVSQLTVNTAMDAFADEAVAGRISADKQAIVKRAYDSYYAALLSEKAVLIAYKTNQNTNALYSAVAIATTASAEVLRLIQQFLPPDRLVKLKGVP